MKKNVIKLLIDVLLFVMFALLFNTHVLGLPFHEVAGIGIGLGIFVHIFLNIQWVKRVTVKLFDSKLPIKTRLGYVLNVFLLISFILIIISGLFISKIIFPNLRFGNEAIFRTLHISISYITLLLIGIHIGLHWKWIKSFFRNIFSIKASKVTGIIAKLFLIIFLLFGGYEIVETNFLTHITSISNVFTLNNSQNIHDGLQQDSQGISENQANGRQKRAEGGGPGGKGSGFDRSNPEGGKGQFQTPNLLSILGIIVKYFGIMSVFATLTYSFEKFLTGRKTKKEDEV